MFARNFSFVILLGLLSACPPSRKPTIKKVQQNHMDLPEVRSVKYKDIKFELSSFFSNNYSTSYTLHDEALTKVIYDMNLYFSVEKFSKDEARDLQFLFEDTCSLVQAVHDHYIIKRRESLTDSQASILKEVPESVAYPGYMQVIHETRKDFINSSYFISTLELGEAFYVFQLIGKEEHMGYLYDDFLEILNSVVER